MFIVQISENKSFLSLEAFYIKRKKKKKRARVKEMILTQSLTLSSRFFFLILNVYTSIGYLKWLTINQL